MKTRKHLILSILVIILVVTGVACGGKENADSGYPAPETALDPSALLNSLEFQSDAGATTKAPNQMAPEGSGTNVPSRTNSWCMNYTKEAAYPDGARFYSGFAKGWLICRTGRGGFENEEGQIIATSIVTTMPTVGFSPWDGVTYAP